MPFVPELFSAPVLARIQAKQPREELVAVPYFAGLMAGEPEALVKSFAAEPQLHDPVRGRVKGKRAFEAFVSETSAWLAQCNASVEDIEHVVTERRGFEEVVLHLDGELGRVELPFALIADRHADGRIDELRIYYSAWPLTGQHANRPPLLQPDPDLRESDIVAEYQRGLAAGDTDAIVAAFEADGYVREPEGGQHIHRRRDGLRDFYEQLFSNDGGIPLERCALVDDGRACALEYNVVQWGNREVRPQAGVAVYVRSQSGKLAAVRIYDDTDRPAPRAPERGHPDE